MTFRTRLLSGIIDTSYYMGGPVLWNRIRGGECTALMYHGISARESFPGMMNHYGYNVKIRDFDEQVRWLRRHCNIVSLHDLQAGENLSDKCTNVLITFDDGYENLYTNALPVLQEHACPALIALPTAFIVEQQPLWNDIIEFAVMSTEREAVGFAFDGETREFDLRTFEGRLALYNALMRQAVVVPQEERSRLIDSAVAELDANISSAIFGHEDYRPLTQEQIMAMANSGLITFASHSVNHYLLAKLSPENKQQELVESKNAVEALCGAACNSFCVPGGSYDSQMLDMAFDIGYQTILTSDEGKLQRDQTVWNRNCIFAGYRMSRFADLVHGPVMHMVRARREILN